MKWLALALFGTFGLSCFVGGLMWGMKRYKLMKEGVRTSGAVVELEESRSTSKEDGRTVESLAYYPVVEFAVSGKTYRFRGSTGSGVPAYEVGAQVAVVYSPANPHDAQVADFEQFWLGPVVIGIFGFIFLVAGIGSFFFIADSDKAFGPEFEARMARDELFEMKQGVPLEATVKEVRQEGSGWLLVCRGGMPNAAKRDFQTMLAIDPGRGIVGKTVTVYADPRDAERYFVHVEPLLQAGR